MAFLLETTNVPQNCSVTGLQLCEPLAWTLPQLHVELFKSQHRSYKSDLLSFIWNLSRLIFLDLARQTITMLLRLILKSWAQVTPLSQPPE